MITSNFDIVNLQHLKICHRTQNGGRNSQQYVGQATTILLLQNMSSLRSLEIHITTGPTNDTKTRLYIPPRAGQIRFPRLTTLALVSKRDNLDASPRRRNTAGAWSDICKGVDYSQLLSLSVYLSKDDVATLTAQMAATTSLDEGLKLRDLSIDVQSAVHSDFLPSCTFLTSLCIESEMTTSPGLSAWKTILNCKRLRHLKLFPNVLGSDILGITKGLPSIFKSLPMLQSLTFGRGWYWIKYGNMVS